LKRPVLAISDEGELIEWLDGLLDLGRSNDMEPNGSESPEAGYPASPDRRDRGRSPRHRPYDASEPWEERFGIEHCWVDITNPV
jgi:hypothetical protein